MDAGTLKQFNDITARVVRSARYKIFKLCSSCPYKKEFFETLENIRLQPQLESLLLLYLGNPQKNHLFIYRIIVPFFRRRIEFFSEIDQCQRLAIGKINFPYRHE
jgi:hypothetical protein